MFLCLPKFDCRWALKSLGFILQPPQSGPLLCSSQLAIDYDIGSSGGRAVADCLRAVILPGALYGGCEKLGSGVTTASGWPSSLLQPVCHSLCRLHLLVEAVWCCCGSAILLLTVRAVCLPPRPPAGGAVKSRGLKLQPPQAGLLLGQRCFALVGSLGLLDCRLCILAVLALGAAILVIHRIRPTCRCQRHRPVRRTADMRKGQAVRTLNDTQLLLGITKVECTKSRQSVRSVESADCCRLAHEAALTSWRAVRGSRS